MLLTQPLRVLIVDGSPADAELAASALAGAGLECAWTRAASLDELGAALDPAPAAVICDHHLPGFTPDSAAEDRRTLRATRSQPQDARAARIALALGPAIEAGQLRLHYQPQLDLRTGRVVAVEALARWTDAELGVVPPSEFVAVTEASDLSLAMGRWVIAEAARQLARWAAAGRGELRLSVNLSGRHFAPSAGLVESLRQAISGQGLNPRSLRIEITETTLIDNAQSTSDVMRRVAALGIEFAVDDFGTGYSSLSYLRRFPISEIKIDRSFITDLTSSAENMVIVRAIIAMAHALGARVVAEGVETEAQLGALRHARCDLAQGYLIGRPTDAAALEALLERPSSLSAAFGVGEQRTLLLVDDEANVAASLKRLLRRDGYRIITAISAAEGFERLGTETVGVVISDQRMPVMCGTEFLSQVKNMYPGTVRMVLSGFTDLASVTAAINEGAIYKFLTKPWEDEVMRAAVRDAFERHELLRENERLGEEARLANRGLAEANAQLETRVAQKTAELSRQLAALKISQEALDRMPVGVVGVDADGTVAAANEYAVIALGACPGSAALDCLPAPLVEILDQAQAQGGEAHGKFGHHAVVCRPLGRASAARGNVLVTIPAVV
ncbi:MAG: EAL domain-containing protein [Burkholderiales bacterium]